MASGQAARVAAQPGGLVWSESELPADAPGWFELCFLIFQVLWLCGLRLSQIA